VHQNGQEGKDEIIASEFFLIYLIADVRQGNCKVHVLLLLL